MRDRQIHHEERLGIEFIQWVMEGKREKGEEERHRERMRKGERERERVGGERETQ